LEEQTVPGLPDATELVVITRRKYRETSLDRFHAAVRLLDGPEWDQAAALLADRRRDRHGPPGQPVKRWKGSCAIAELTPIVDALMEEVDGRSIRIGDRWLADFASCNYLRLDLDPDIIRAVPSYLERWGTHPSWSRLLGSPALYEEIEAHLTELLGTEDALA